MMLTIVPIHIIMKIPKMQEFLNKQISGKGLTSSGGKGSSGGSGVSTKDQSTPVSSSQKSS